MSMFEVTPEQLLEKFRQDWPKEYEITTLRLMLAQQHEQIAVLTQRQQDSDDVHN